MRRGHDDALVTMPSAARVAAFVRLAALLLGLAALLVAPRAQAQVDEREMKAAYLFNFIEFTQWPVPPDEPFRLCVLGRTRLDEQLARLDGKVARGDRHISVRHVGLDDSLEQCHALFVDEGQRANVDELLKRLAASPVLTVTDGSGLADRGLMIEIHKRAAKLGFEVNLNVARRANISFSARMLKLASYVAGSI
jgi:hypothetical protein